MHSFRLVMVALLLVGGAAVAQAMPGTKEFSADMVMLSEGKSTTGKVYVTKNKFRNDMGGMSNIIFTDEKKMIMLMPSEKMYMEHVMEPRTAATVASDKVEGEIDRKDLGIDTVDGRSAHKYLITYSVDGKQDSLMQWLDEATGIPVKTSSEDGKWSVEYRNLKEGKQPESLFEIPAGYQKFEMPSVAKMFSGLGK